MAIRLIPFNGKPVAEKRPAFFLKAFGLDVEMMRIVSFGTCNFHCPYCKRDGQYINPDGSIYTSQVFDDGVVFSAIDEALQNNERVRLSGGDPCMHIKDSMRIAEYCKERGHKISIAHNGSSPKFVEKIMPYLAYAAIDIKATNGSDMNLRAGLTNGQGDKMLANTLRVQEMLSNAGIYVDARTPVFSTTTLDDMMRTAELVLSSGNPDYKFWTVRAYKEVTGVDWKPLPKETTLEYIELVAQAFPELKIGFRAKWAAKGFLYWNLNANEGGAL
jgi:pyruvate formate lyase activating enzyme